MFGDLTVRLVGFGVALAACVVAFVFVASQFPGSVGPWTTETGKIEIPNLQEAAPEVVWLEEPFRELAAQAAELVEGCEQGNLALGFPVVHGQALVWDAASDKPSPVHGTIPADLRASDPNAEIVLFLITRQDRRAVTEYNSGFLVFQGDRAGVKGYQTRTEMCLIELPSGRAVGKYSIDGEGPPMGVRLEDGQKEVDGDWVTPLSTWINDCLESSALGRLAEQAAAVLPECRTLGHRVPAPHMPQKGVIWTLWPEAQIHRFHRSHEDLADDRRAVYDDEEVAVFLVTREYTVSVPAGAGQTDGDRIDQLVSVVLFPGAIPVGSFRLEGPMRQPYSSATAGSHEDEPMGRLTEWVTQFLDSPSLAIERASDPEDSVDLQEAAQRFPPVVRTMKDGS